MPKRGFFDLEDTPTRTQVGLVAKCHECGLFRKCKSPKMPVWGLGKKKILVIGEAPGKMEDRLNKPFCGKTGNLIKEKLRKHGIDLKQDCWVTNSIICRAPKDKVENYPKSVEYCRPNVVKAITELNPEMILLFGVHAVESVMSWLWKEDCGGLQRWVGWNIPHQRLNCWVCPNYHPSALFYENGDTIGVLFDKYLERSLQNKGRPYEVVPDYKAEVNVCLDDAKAAHIIHNMAAFGYPVAIDYETNRLKPDGEEAKIVSCAVSDGNETISYLWRGEAIEATRELIRSKCPKIASNLKFEERWSISQVGTRMCNWYWDTMLAAHVLDNRPEITSIKFQAFVLLGQDSWDDKIKPFLKADSANANNKIHSVNFRELLLYGGLDALCEYKVAMIQRRQMGL